MVLEKFEPWLTGAAGAEVLKPAPEDMLMWPDAEDEPGR